MRLVGSAVFACLLLAAPFAASARDTEVFLPVSQAIQSDAKGHLLSQVKFYMKGQKHPAVAKEMLTISADRATRGAFRSDEDSCRVAFLSALRVLQDRAVQEGANGIVEIVSTTRGTTTESSSDFRCVAGFAIVHVGLKGTIVKLR